MDPTDSDGLDMMHVAPLGEDNIPDQNQAHMCFSCYEPINGVYCAACGNKNDNYRRSIWSLGVELFASLTAFENRIWRSLRALILQPGLMAREFADGARRRWTSPIRLYLAMSIVLFGYVSLTKTQLVAFGTVQDSRSIAQAQVGDMKISPKIFFLERKSTIREQVTDEAISAFENTLSSGLSDDDGKTLEQLEAELVGAKASSQALQDQIDNPAMKYGIAGLKSGKATVDRRITKLESLIAERKNPTPEETETRPEVQTPLQEFQSGFMDGATGRTADTDIKEESEAEDNQGMGPSVTPGDNGSSLNITGFDGETISLDQDGFQKLVITALRNPDRVNAPINRYLPRIMFFMMPFSMLMGAIFIRSRKNAMLFDHLVHAAYIHAFSFLLLFVFILLVQFTPIPGLLLVYTLILLIYLPMSAKRMFGRGWFKTIFASYAVGAVYTLLMFTILLALLVIGLQEVASEISRAQGG